ncbi:MAG: T9SS type A sorting domain-containing protein, partial [Chitinispirillaceae bacterium]|nr:T9SS type A sorting domain-containing protein [Chitinispirillaceae bacterium]
TSSSGGNPATVGDRYTLDGNKTSSELTSTFLGGFALAATVDRKHLDWLDKAYRVQDSLIDVEEKYFGSSLKMIYLLLLSGNMPDLWNPPAHTTPNEAALTNGPPQGVLELLPMNDGKVRYTVPRAGMVTLEIHSLQGKLIARLLEGSVHTGIHTAILPTSLRNGMYLVTLRTAFGELSRKFTVN